MTNPTNSSQSEITINQMNGHSWTKTINNETRLGDIKLAFTNDVGLSPTHRYKFYELGDENQLHDDTVFQVDTVLFALVYVLEPIPDNDTLRILVSELKDNNQTLGEETITKYGDISEWNVSLITDMSYLFENETRFNEPLNAWDVSNVTNMNSMFYNATSFNKPLNNWNISKATSMYDMFHGATSFNQSRPVMDTTH